MFLLPIEATESSRNNSRFGGKSSVSDATRINIFKLANGVKASSSLTRFGFWSSFNGATNTNSYYSSQYGVFLVSKTYCSLEMYLNTLVATYITTTSSFSCFDCQRYISTSIITIYGKSLIHLFGHISEYEIYFLSALRI